MLPALILDHSLFNKHLSDCHAPGTHYSSYWKYKHEQNLEKFTISLMRKREAKR